MKKSATETGHRPPAKEKTENKQVLRLKKRPLVSLTDDQMGDVAGGHPHNTCDDTCPRTCPRTCPCPDPTDTPTCPDSCDTCLTGCFTDCYSECPSDCLTQCFDRGC